MKKLIAFTILTALLLITFITSDFWSFSEEKYIPQKVLDISQPINVNIDVDLLRSLSPAYEQ